ncbi:MAG: hypothetical protein DDT31_01674 [Syntrophomonadaceae bacterium]|nr:hypothetical protein [Bacillota bacterium]
MLSNYRSRKLKRAEVKKSYTELKHDQAQIRYNRATAQFEQAFYAVHGRRCRLAERPQGMKKIIDATMILFATLHEREITNGLVD